MCHYSVRRQAGKIMFVRSGFLAVCSALTACGRAPDHGGEDSSDVPPWIDCDQDGDQHDSYACKGDDCDDGDAAIHPDAEELCNGQDDDCDGADRFLRPWYEDSDGDGYGDVETSIIECYAPSGYVGEGTDCDDGNPAVSPGEPEHCDNIIDDDCDGLAAEGADDDGDGFISDACVGGDDCNDGDANVHVGAPEICGDGIDSDCDGR